MTHPYEVKTNISRRRVTLVATGLAMGLAVGSVVNVESVKAATTPVDLKSTRVFVVGDSLTVGSASALRTKLKRDVKSVQIDARVGRHTPEGIARLRSNAAKSAGIWVVALGTNDGPSASQTRVNVNRVMKLAGPHRQVIWVNVVRPGGYHRVNKVLRTMDTQNHRLSVIDWAAVVRDRRDFLAGDSVHLTSKGYRERATAIRRAVLQLATAPTAVPTAPAA